MLYRIFCPPCLLDYIISVLNTLHLTKYRQTDSQRVLSELILINIMFLEASFQTSENSK